AEFMGKLLYDKLVSKLRGSRLVRGVRGLGLMLGVDLRVAPGSVIKCVQSRRVLTLKAGSTVVRLLPPYLINEGDVEWGVEAVARCVHEELSLKTPA
ncbi:MAG: aminotransferase class III-fold pyridoxal phosphate-dependent enzyme, partial [Acidilobaceae archaeon]